MTLKLPIIVAITVIAFVVVPPLGAVLLGPSPSPTTPYLSFGDSPFNGLSFSFFYLEDFEDHLFNTPGVTANFGGVTSVVFGPSIHDSVDADDGTIDGSGLDGDSFYYGSGSTGITFTFDPVVLGSLPTHAGIVWTDGAGLITFEAFDASSASLGTATGSHADGSVSGTTGSDRFYGAIDTGGISAIKISNASGGIEVDHLQYGLSGEPIPEPGTLLLLGTGLAGLAGYGKLTFRRRKRA
jgi:hypothetical protein